jgi:hypothetical protein
MSTELAKIAVEALKLAPRHLVAVAAACGVLLICGPRMLDALGLREFTDNHRHWLGLAFLAATALFVVNQSEEIVRWVREKIRSAQLKKKLLNRLRTLTEEEKQILRYYLAKQTRTNSLRFQDGIVQGLAAAGIIYQSASLGNLHSGFSYNISDYAWECLTEDPTLVEGVTNTYRSDAPEW